MIVTLELKGIDWMDGPLYVACTDWPEFTGQKTASATWDIRPDDFDGALKLVGDDHCVYGPRVRCGGVSTSCYPHLLTLMRQAGCEWRDGVLTAYVRRIDEITEPQGSQPKDCNE